MKKPSEYLLNDVHYITRIRKEEVIKLIDDDIFFQCCIGGRRLAEYRCTIGHIPMTMLSQEQLAEKIGESVKTIISVDSGEKLHLVDRAKVRVGALIYDFVYKYQSMIEKGCSIGIDGSYEKNEYGENLYKIIYDGCPD